MNWIKLGPKEPDFNERVLWMDENGDWWGGELKSKRTTANETNYTVLGPKGEEVLNPTHFMRITPPKEK